MAGLLFTAYQKFYSALNNLDRFDKEANFFDNISCLDAFFSEFRNVTFVMQKSLKHTEFYGIYEEMRDKFLTDHWFVEKRNQTTKEQPFKLIKEIQITEYLPFAKLDILKESFSVENDSALSELIDPIKTFFQSTGENEIFFSAAFKFHEENSDIELWAKIESGIGAMQSFLDSVYGKIGEKCSLCEQLQDKISELKVVSMPSDFLFVNDYAYYPIENVFEKADRLTLMWKPPIIFEKKPLNKWFQQAKGVDDPFEKFILLHAILGKTDLMPATMIVFSDEMYSMDVYHSSMKTTFYRKICEVADLIHTENIKEVFHMCTYVVVENTKENFLCTSKERQEKAKIELLVFSRVRSDMKVQEVVFRKEDLIDIAHMAHVMVSQTKDSLDISEWNMQPILEAFAAKAGEHKI